ncbi:MAG TPA: hypothetical protein VK745_06800 [Polyangiaceae bacterium]|jgi:hypothetical protein|nr:hypothetical protein [Polyangiaceae bacterium]
MSKDLLSEATRALRDTEEVSELEARATRARVMSGLHQTRVRRRTRYAFLLPIAATFVAASAWGAASGKVQLVWASIEHMVATTHDSGDPSARVKASSDARPPAPLGSALPLSANDGPEQSAPLATPAAPEATPIPSTLGVTGAGTVAAQRAAPRAAAPSAAASVAPREDPSLGLYRVAHAAHFVDHDPVRALAAWDAYLAAAPHGAFAPEAQYNRALSLVRLGRNDEATSALRPFAEGAYGGYRQAEASALLERLSP